MLGGGLWGYEVEQYLYGRKFKLQTDHQPLAFLAQAKLTNWRLMNWSLSLQQYHIHVEYIMGSQNIGSDYLSCLTELSTESGPTEEAT